jgi:hypothetical protein
VIRTSDIADGAIDLAVGAMAMKLPRWVPRQREAHRYLASFGDDGLDCVGQVGESGVERRREVLPGGEVDRR